MEMNFVLHTDIQKPNQIQLGNLHQNEIQLARKLVCFESLSLRRKSTRPNFFNHLDSHKWAFLVWPQDCYSGI